MGPLWMSVSDDFYAKTTKPIDAIGYTKIH